MRENRENMGLYRGKRKDNGKWICGHLLEQNIPDYHSYIVASFIAEQDNRHTEIIEFAIYEVIPETVGQYTVLTDKNGKKIFEGDIVERISDGEQAVISWLKYSACFGLSFDGWCCGFDNYDDNLPSDFEIIGNIHDNPELLEGGGGNG